MQTILGIDGGGTKTQAAIVDEHGRLLGVGLGGSSNYDAAGIEAARASIEQAVTSARHAAGLPEHPFASVFLGLAGVVSAHDHEIVRAIAESLQLATPAQIGIDHDCRVALAGGLSGRPGIVLIVGTGSSCFGINARGEGWRAGGWGHLISDEGSSYWLGIQAMRAATASYDGRSGQTLLENSVMRHLGISDMNKLMHRLYVSGLSKPEVAALAPLVIEAARVGDAVALGLLREGSEFLAMCVLAVARRLMLDGGRVELTVIGGLLRAGGIVLDPLRDAVLARLPECQFTSPELPPVLGACLLALRQCGIELDEQVSRALSEGARRLDSV